VVVDHSFTIAKEVFMKVYEMRAINASTKVELCTFFIDEAGVIDEQNLPVGYQVADLLKTMLTQKVTIEPTGYEEEY
jgi:hypothetical protein